MKKFIILLLILMVSASVFAFDMGRFMLGISFGISGSSEKSAQNGTQVSSGKFGFVVRLRGDYMIDDLTSATLMISYDSPSKNVLESTFLKSNSEVQSPKYIKIFTGISKYSTNNNLLVATGIGPELAIDITSGTVGGGAATYIRTSYSLPGSNLLFDSTAVGEAEWIKDMPTDDDVHFYLDGNVSAGFTYCFK